VRAKKAARTTSRPPLLQDTTARRRAEPRCPWRLTMHFVEARPHRTYARGMASVGQSPPGELVHALPVMTRADFRSCPIRSPAGMHPPLNPRAARGESPVDGAVQGGACSRYDEAMDAACLRWPTAWAICCSGGARGLQCGADHAASTARTLVARALARPARSSPRGEQGPRSGVKPVADVRDDREGRRLVEVARARIIGRRGSGRAQGERGDAQLLAVGPPWEPQAARGRRSRHEGVRSTLPRRPPLGRATEARRNPHPWGAAHSPLVSGRG